MNADYPDDYKDIKGTIDSEQPNNSIYKYSGSVTLGSNETDKRSLNAENLLLRGCMLRNTDFVIGIVVFTGHKTKIM